MASKDGIDGLSTAQRRTLLNLCCRIARADGIVADAEIERLSKLFYYLGDHVIAAAEVDRWLEDGPPEVEELLPREAEATFLEHAREIVVADARISHSESQLVAELLHTYFLRD